MLNKKNLKNRYNENTDLHDLYELIELGAEKEEIAKEFGISEKQVIDMMDEIHKDR
jgi:uncharacterized protein (DUF433 family)